MITKLQGKVEKVSIIKNIEPSLDLCEMQIDFDTLKIFYDSNLLLEFIGEDVFYSTRTDVIDGVTTQVICELALLKTIQTVESTQNIKLIPEGTSRTICNTDIKAMKFGGYYPACVALMSSYEYGSSPKASWFDVELIDKNSIAFSFKIFTTGSSREEMEDIINPMIGTYVHMNIESTKFGFRTEEITSMPNEVEEYPSVLVAKAVVQEMINADPALVEYTRQYDFMNCMSSVIDGEPGYSFVRMASELYLVNAIDNISTDMDIRAMKRAIICSRGYLLPHKTEWSRPMLNINKVRSIAGIKTDVELILILDALSAEKHSSTKQTYIKIKGMVNDIINIRRGIENEETNSNVLSTINYFNGLL